MAEYPFANRTEEFERLVQQNQLFDGSTETTLREAGLAPGMTVLDLGTGTGAVAAIAGRIVGASGRVESIDNSEKSVASAREHLARLELPQVVVEHVDAAEFRPSRTYDAIIARLFWMYIEDPQQLMHRLLRHLRPGGLVYFCESDLELGALSYPKVDLFDACFAVALQVSRNCGVRTAIGRQLPNLMKTSGLHGLTIQPLSFVGGAESPMPARAARILWGMREKIDRFQLWHELVPVGVTPENIQQGWQPIAARIQRDAELQGAFLFDPVKFAVWGRSPGPTPA